ncbi:hypothetical protein KY084_12550 [Stakelama sp. CBK3Z-3]|uniref:Uncharacterized protein n=1 Tax=Stakelama flava TaxID=2860338 RepID=A0ABS6XNA3_9SPHN|nr:hypothetical protein [Stakelama flava]MBW4331700.1 hypothetical protein [Stakelama flava]
MNDGTWSAAEAKAKSMVEIYGEHAHQALVDQIVSAIRSGNDQRVSELDRALRVMESRTRTFR